MRKRQGYEKYFCPSLHRRTFLKLCALTAIAGLLPDTHVSAMKNYLPHKKELFLHNIHTGETIKTVYRENGNFIPSALCEINRIFRDHRTGKIKQIDTGVLDLLSLINEKLGNEAPFHIISGYRSPRTNALLRKSHNGVAKNSYHTHGKAVDISIPGCPLKKLRSTAIALKSGGVGYYPRSGFVHLDVGNFRIW